MKKFLLLAGLALGSAVVSAADTPTSFKFQFAPGKVAPGYTQVKPDLAYNATTGYGFEPGANITAVDRGGDDPLHAGYVTSGNLFLFSVAVPEGNYKVTLTLGDAKEDSTTTVKAEARRLMLEHVHTDAGKFDTRTIYVSVRRPVLPDGTKLKLDVQEVDPEGKLLTYTWDDKLTLEFCDTKPAVSALTIEKVADPVTVFIIGDSTVTDQHAEPYGTWGQMVARWFKPPVVVANFAESGETLKAFRKEHRWEKILGEIKPGDYVFMQFGTNDLNKSGHNGIWPADDHEGDWPNTYVEGEDYKNLLKQYAAEAKAKGATPVIVSPMTKINARTGEINFTGLRNYPKDAMDAAKEAGVAGIDLNAMSVQVDEALNLGPQMSQVVYTAEGLHQRTYGGYLFSRCIIEGLKQDKLDLVKYFVDDAGTFDPQHPQPLPQDFKVPLEPSPVRGGRGGRGGFGPGFGSGRDGFGRGRGTATPAASGADAPAPAPAAASAPGTGN
ncbi:MAG TPA: GDSL-type esterase/lipase family protein [Opitutales bacterium]|nr:GDSL-type esterase/lipase family protein [Opitutales bacterium]